MCPSLLLPGIGSNLNDNNTLNSLDKLIDINTLLKGLSEAKTGNKLGYASLIFFQIKLNSYYLAILYT